MRQIRIAEMVANELRSEILSGELKVGERLGPQDVLLKRFNVSLPAIREALGILEMERLVKVQRGSVGGAVVQSPDPELIAYMTAVILEARRTKLSAVTEALAHFEPLCASLCAGREDRRDELVPKLAEVVALHRDHLGTDELIASEASLQFHEIIIQECGNAAVALTVGSLSALWRSHLKNWTATVRGTAEFPELSVQSAILHAHERMLDAIDAGDTAEAHRVALKHAVKSHAHHHAEPTIGAGAMVECHLLR